ncbi:hypothetical protein QJS04_geneDACA000583 [Acorus gramineus]|uniref:Uncharacterized protein n=1 Tax=Acorus gramineus TaxID=55184 RepID=A0AAV9ATS3_ACOGR|nr:hypothetical protein QJS04_geneDACA000583 [Acorus gramineus]
MEEYTFQKMSYSCQSRLKNSNINWVKDAQSIHKFYVSGFGRRVVKIERGDLPDQFEVGVKKGREMMELMDYQEPGANTNPHLGGLFSPPPPIPLN